MSDEELEKLEELMVEIYLVPTGIDNLKKMKNKLSIMPVKELNNLVVDLAKDCFKLGFRIGISYE